MTARKAAEKPQEAREDAPLVGVFVAKQPLLVDGVLAFNTGDIVPAGHVQKFGWRDLVRDFDDDKEED